VFLPASFLVELIITSQKIFAAWQDYGDWNPSLSEDNAAPTSSSLMQQDHKKMLVRT
jgi:hypothetical protein